MPNLDGTGPQGKGPLTGRKAGNCPGANARGVNRRGQGRGLGRGRGPANAAQNSENK